VTDFVTLDGVRYAVRDPQVVSYAMHESPEQRKARGDAKPPMVSYTHCRIIPVATAAQSHTD
jgi:hypothetical protein